MEPIDLKIDSINYTAMPMADGGFRIFQDKNELGKIYPDFEDHLDIKWVPTDIINPSLAQEIGNAIEAKEM